MTTRPSVSLPARHAGGLVRMVWCFIGLAAGAVLLAAGIAWGLMQLVGRWDGVGGVFAPAFAVTTPLLLLGSIALQQALRWVRLEKQRPFRRWLLAAVLVGAAFVGTQTYALWTLFPADRGAAAASLGVTPFALALATLHGLHFLVAVLFVSFVTARAWGDRYDHEYYWGVTVCAWFWHALGFVWLAILAVFAVGLLGG